MRPGTPSSAPDGCHSRVTRVSAGRIAVAHPEPSPDLVPYLPARCRREGMGEHSEEFHVGFGASGPRAVAQLDVLFDRPKAHVTHSRITVINSAKPLGSWHRPAR